MTLPPPSNAELVRRNPDLEGIRKELARVRAEKVMLMIMEGFARAREGRITYDPDAARELWDILEALGPMLRENKAEFERESDYIAVNTILGMMLRGAKNDQLAGNRRTRILLSQVLEFQHMFRTMIDFLKLSNRDPEAA